MRFRTVLLASLVALVGVTVVATLLAVSGVIDHAAQGELADKIERGRRVFEDVQRYRATLYRAESRAIADEPRLKAAVDTQEVSQETVLGVAADLRKAIQSDLFLLTDGTGHLLADVADANASGFDLSKNPEVAAALQSGDGFGIWTHDGHAYQVQAHRLTFGATTVGVVIIGYELDDRVADSVTQQTGDVVVVELDGAPIAASLVDGHIVDRATLRAALAPVAADAGAPVEVRLGGQRFLAVAAPFPGRHEGGKSDALLGAGVDRPRARGQAAHHAHAVGHRRHLDAARHLPRVRRVAPVVAADRRAGGGDAPDLDGRPRRARRAVGRARAAGARRVDESHGRAAGGVARSARRAAAAAEGARDRDAHPDVDLAARRRASPASRSPRACSRRRRSAATTTTCCRSARAVGSASATSPATV